MPEAQPVTWMGPESGRWSARHKEAVVDAVLRGEATRDQVKAAHGLTDEELDSWSRRLGRFGRRGLHQTKLQRLRA